MNTRKAVLLTIFFLLYPLICWSQEIPQAVRPNDPIDIHPMDRVVLPVDSAQRTMLKGSVHPLARPENMVGEVTPSQAMERMVLVLRPDPSQEEALSELLRAQQDPESPYYHRWLTPEGFGEHYGVSLNDLGQVVNWLEAQGMKVNEIPSSRRAIVFSGTAGQVEETFHTQMRKYSVKGQVHFANATNPEIPVALAGVVNGVFSLHDFRSIPAHETLPAYTLANGVNLLMPRDWDTIYDVLPLYSQGLDGSGQSIAVIGRTDVALTDVEAFRSMAALPAKDPQKIFVNGVNPGFPDCEDEAESALDVEWAGAIAKNATIDFVSAQSGATDGVVLAAQYAVTNNVAPVVTMSYLHCENTLSDGGQSLWGSLWAQAAAQGQSVFVAAGDSGAAGCDSATATVATQGKAVNAICSTPNSTCVGGTEFNDTANPGAYWTGTNGQGMSSALSYIPELAWNESGWSNTLYATGGGISGVYARPGWQSAPGVPPGSMRLVPDISATSAVHDAYVIQVQGGTFYIAGTSAATPSLASVTALVLENIGARVGNINPSLYTLATQHASGGPAVFHDITSGNNSVPGVTGYSAGAGYDMATGLGSVDAFLLVNSWANSSASNFSLESSTSSLSISPGGQQSATLTMSAQGGFNSPVTLSAAGAPAGVNITFSSTTLTAGNSVTMAVAANAGVAASTFTLTVTGTGGGFTRTLAFGVTIAAGTFTLTANPTAGSVNVGSSAQFKWVLARLNGFNSAVALSVSGLPSGVTASFSPGSIAAGSTTSTLTISAAATAAVGTSALSVTGTGGGVAQSQILTLAVENPNYTFTASSTIASVAQGGSSSVTLTTTPGTGFNSIVYLSVSGVPSGVTATLSPTSIAAPGRGSSTLKLGVATGTTAGTYHLTLGAVGGGGATKTITFTLTVLPPPNITLAASATSMSVTLGKSGSIKLTTATTAGFSASISLSVSGLPAGVTAGFAPASIASPGNGSSTLTLAAASTAATGAFTLTITAKGGGVTKTLPISLGLVPAPTFTLSSNLSSASLSRGGTTQVTLTAAPGAGFSASIGLSIMGLPSGVTASFNPATIAAPGKGSSTLKLSASSSATICSSTVTVTATGGGIAKTVTFTLGVSSSSASAR